MNKSMMFSKNGRRYESTRSGILVRDMSKGTTNLLVYAGQDDIDKFISDYDKLTNKIDSLDLDDQQSINYADKLVEEYWEDNIPLDIIENVGKPYSISGFKPLEYRGDLFYEEGDYYDGVLSLIYLPYGDLVLDRYL